MKKTLSLLILCLILTAFAQAQSKEEKEVADAVEALKKAMVDADKASLESLTAAELSYGHSSGKTEDKASFIESLVSGKSDFLSIDLTEQSIKVVGKTALVRHNLAGTTSNEGKPGTVSLGVLLVWQLQQGKWKLLARQATKL